jgi:hypothetical protein
MKQVEMGGACRAHRGYEKCLKFLVEWPDGKKALGRPDHK